MCYWYRLIISKFQGAGSNHLHGVCNCNTVVGSSKVPQRVYFPCCVPVSFSLVEGLLLLLLLIVLDGSVVLI